MASAQVAVENSQSIPTSSSVVKPKKDVSPIKNTFSGRSEYVLQAVILGAICVLGK